MGRPKGSRNKKTLAKLGLLSKAEVVKLKLKDVPQVEDTRTDQQIIDMISERFTMYSAMVQGAADPNSGITSLITSGSAGVGKTYTATYVLDALREQNDGFRWKQVNGAASAIGLYVTAYDYRHPGNVIVLDDADRVFDDEESLNILKVLLDTSVERNVSWITEHSLFRGQDAQYPREFTFNGSMIFLTNKDFQDYVDRGTGKYVEHMEALLSRAIYLDLKMHSRREVALWAKYIVLQKQVLQGSPIYLDRGGELEAVNWVVENRDRLREVSIRTALKAGKLMKRFPTEWKRACELVLLKESV